MSKMTKRIGRDIKQGCRSCDKSDKTSISIQSSVSESEQNETSATEPVQINIYKLVLEMAREDKFFLTIFLIVILILVLLLQLVSVFLYCTLFDSHFCKVIFN